MSIDDYVVITVKDGNTKYWMVDTQKKRLYLNKYKLYEVIDRFKEQYVYH